jgi:hypothetical protein
LADVSPLLEEVSGEVNGVTRVAAGVEKGNGEHARP